MDVFNGWILLITAITVVVFLYKRLTKNYGYWEAQGIPSEKGYLIFGSDFQIFRKNFLDIDLERFKKHGRIYGSYLFSLRQFNVSDPEILKSILIKDFPVFVNRQLARTGVKMFDKGVGLALDDEWKRIRSIISPTFSSGKIRKMTVILKNSAKKLSRHLMDLSEKGTTINIKEEISKFSLEVIGACAFGITFDPFENPNHPFIMHTKKAFTGGTKTILGFVAISLLPGFMKSVKQLFLRLIGLKFFQDAAEEIIQKRRLLTEEKPVDFLQLIIDAKDETGENSEINQEEINGVNHDDSFEKKTHWKKTLDEDEIVAQCTIFLAAGHDSIASTISFVAYNLACNPDAQEILLREVDDVWEKEGDIDYDIVNKMTYLNAVINETLRLQPVAVRIQRQAKEDYQIPNTNIIIPKNCFINIPLFSLHRDPELFPEPDEFKPERFLPENRDNIIPYSYMPFGDGPRNCIAMRFALMEVKICLAYILRYIKFAPTEETKKPLKYFFGLGGLQVEKIPIQLQKRNTAELR